MSTVAIQTSPNTAPVLVSAQSAQKAPAAAAAATPWYTVTQLGPFSVTPSALGGGSFFIGLLLYVLLLMLRALLVWVLLNYLLPLVFRGAPRVSYLMALALVVLADLLF